MQQLQQWTNHQRQAAEAGPQPSTQRRQVAHLVAVQRADHTCVAINVLNVPLPQVACKGLEASKLVGAWMTRPATAGAAAGGLHPPTAAAVRSLTTHMEAVCVGGVHLAARAGQQDLPAMRLLRGRQPEASGSRRRSAGVTVGPATAGRPLAAAGAASRARRSCRALPTTAGRPRARGAGPPTAAARGAQLRCPRARPGPPATPPPEPCPP